MEEFEQIEVDVLFVGAGPAALSSAYHLASLLEAKKIKNISIAVIEKSKEPGDHILSGAVMDPKALRELIPDFEETLKPLLTSVKQDSVMFLTSKSQFKFPIVPSSLSNRGNHIISAGRLTQWLAGKAQEKGVDIYFQTPGAELLWKHDSVAGVRTQSAGLDKHGNKKSAFQPGVDIRAKVTVLAEGAFGSLTQSLINKNNLMKNKNPQTFSTGIKEIWEVKPDNHREGTVIHTLGFPLKQDTFGGGWIYHMKENRVSIGFVVGLDYSDPYLDIQEEMQKYKTHPFISKLLEGGKLIAYGAKTIAEGGYYSMPKLYGDGYLLIGESAGFLNSARLKGIHLAIKSGMLAAEVLVRAIEKNDFSNNTLSEYDRLFEASWAKKELWKVRNFHQGFKKGLWAGIINMGLQIISGGRGLLSRYPGHEDWTAYRKLKPEELTELKSPKPKTRIVPDQQLTFNKMSDLYLSGVYHEENQPSHIIIQDTNICYTRCRYEYGNPCQYFCPANVFEWVHSESGFNPDNTELKLSPSNCIHCKTCAIKDPYQIVLWKTPEGGGGPRYKNM